jgi:hypothetical protein
MKHLTKTLSIFIACVFTLTACQASDNANNNLYQEKSEQSVSPTASASPAPSTKKQLSPFEAISVSGGVSDIMDKAITALKDVCMHEKGFTNFKSEPSVTDSDWDTRLHKFDIETAKKHGYTTKGAITLDKNGNNWSFDGEKWVNENEYAKERIKENEEREKNKSEEEKGEESEAGKCEDVAFNKLYEDLDSEGAKTRGPQISKLRTSAEEATNADSRTVSLNQNWSECMKKDGHSFSNPTAARKETFDLADDLDINSPRKKAEIAIATPDATCQADLNYYDTWLGILYEHENRTIQENLPLFEQEKAYVASLQKRAEDIIKEYG